MNKMGNLSSENQQLSESLEKLQSENQQGDKLIKVSKKSDRHRIVQKKEQKPQWRMTFHIMVQILNYPKEVGHQPLILSAAAVSKTGRRVRSELQKRLPAYEEAGLRKQIISAYFQETSDIQNGAGHEHITKKSRGVYDAKDS